MLILVGPTCDPIVGLAMNLNFTRALIGFIDTLRICVMARGDTNANGFAWNSKNTECYGITNANQIDTKETNWKSCIFTSKLVIGMIPIFPHNIKMKIQYDET